jgi:hypothetical protein
MMTRAAGQLRSTPDVSQFQFETLDQLPCGCIVAIHSVRPSGVAVVSLEAKGPYCSIRGHRTNKVIRLGEPFDLLDYPGEDDGEPAGTSA